MDHDFWGSKKQGPGRAGRTVVKYREHEICNHPLLDAIFRETNLKYSEFSSQELPMAFRDWFVQSGKIFTKWTIVCTPNIDWGGSCRFPHQVYKSHQLSESVLTAWQSDMSRIRIELGLCVYCIITNMYIKYILYILYCIYILPSMIAFVIRETCLLAIHLITVTIK